jgi:hypothetical protein
MSRREQARARINQVFEESFSEVIPADEGKPLRGKTFAEFEDQVEAAGRKVMTVSLEERAAVDAAAWREKPGCCPRCHSEHVYLEEQLSIREVRSAVGLLTIRLQNCRCRACDGSFSPSASRLATAQ